MYQALQTRLLCPETYLVKVESIFIRLLLLLLPRLHSLLRAVQLLQNRRITWCILQRLVQIFHRTFITLLAHLRLAASKVRLRLILVTDSLNLQRLCRTFQRLDELVGFVLEQGAVEVDGDLEGLKLGEEVCGVAIEWGGVLVEIAQRLLVFLDAEVEVAFLEGGVAHVFELGCDFQNVVAFPLFVGVGLLIFGEVFVWVAGYVGCLFCGLLVVLACELTAVYGTLVLTWNSSPRDHLTDDGSIMPWLVAALCLEVLNRSYDALAIDDLAKHNMLLVQVWCRNGGDEELRAVGA
jgi:hypothetical protein